MHFNAVRELLRPLGHVITIPVTLIPASTAPVSHLKVPVRISSVLAIPVGPERFVINPNVV